MPKVLHTVTVAFEVTTEKLVVLDNVLKCMEDAALSAIIRKAHYLNNLGTSKIEVIK